MDMLQCKSYILVAKKAPIQDWSEFLNAETCQFLGLYICMKCPQK